jgi:hypothetical protein
MSGARRNAQHAPITAVHEAMRVPGTPLGPRERAEFEAAFGCDLSEIRVHTDALAAAAAGAVNARAFTVGRDIFFAAGAFEPRTPRGRTVIAHEIAHALQDQRRVDPSELDGAAELTMPGDLVELGADAAVAAIAGGRLPAPQLASAGLPQARISRLLAGLLDRRDAADPAQLIARVAETVLTTLASDPDDRLGRVRRTLLGLDDRTRRLVFARLVSADWRHLIEVLDGPAPEGADRGDARELPGDETPDTKEKEPTPDTEAATKIMDGTKDASVPDEPSVEAKPIKDVAAPPLAPDADGDKAEAKPQEPKGEQHKQDKLHGAKPHPAARAGRAAPPRGARKPLAGGGAPPVAVGGGAPEAAEPAAGPAELPVAAEAEHPAGVLAKTADAPGAAGPPGSEPAPAADGGAAEMAEPSPGAETDKVGPVPDAAMMAVREAPQPAAEGPPPGIADAEPMPSAPVAPPAEEAAPPPVPQEEALTGEAVSTLASETAAPDSGAQQGEAEVTATRVRPGPGAAARDAGAQDPDTPAGEAEGEVTATRVRPGAEAASAGAMPIGDLPPEQDDGHEDTGGGGGGGGAAVADAPEEPAPAVSANADPATAMGTVATLDPVPAQQALGGVTAAIGRTSTADHGELANAPPEATPPAAPPGGAPPKPAAAAPAAPAIVKVPEAAAPPPTPIAAPNIPNVPIPAIAAPHVTSNADGKVTAADAQHIGESVSALPTSDPALNVTAGAAPALVLDGATDPRRAAEQREAVAKSTHDAAEAARQDAARPMGEDHIVPTVKAETLRGEVPAAKPAAAGAEAAPAEADVAIAVVARERAGDQVRAAAVAGSQDLSAKRAEQQTKMTQARTDTQSDMDKEIAASGETQVAERNKARGAVTVSRGQWNGEQHDLVKKADTEGDEEVTVAQRQAHEHQTKAKTEADGHIADGNRKIADTRKDAETKARVERARARKESDNAGFFSRVASAIGSFFDGIRKAIHAAFEFARKLVADAIAAAQRLAAEAIDRARNAVVGLIRKAGAALIAIGDRVLAAFPTLREKFHNTINKLVDAAVAVVNKIADTLKKGVKLLLDLLGKALTFILDAYEALYMAAVNVVAGAIKAAINIAKAVVQAIGVFAQLIRDIVSNPGQWLRNLGSALYDGVRNHLWKALKAAIKEWFNSKVEAVVGIGKLIFQVLAKGGIPFKRIAAMVWVAVKAAIPRAIIEFLIQKVISMLIPAAAAIMAIIEGLQAAWATASRIIAAVERFVTFLKAVKGGNAGPQFANAVAAAAVAVIDFTANFIISKIGKGAKSVGSKLSGIAARIMAFLKKGAAAIGRGLRKVGQVIMRGVRAIGRGLAAAARWIANSKIGRALIAAGRWIANSKLGKAIARAYQAIKKKIKEAKEKIKAWWEKRNSPEAKQKRLDKAVAAIRPSAEALLSKGVGRARFWLQRQYWRVRYLLSSIGIEGGQLVAAINPRAPVGPAEESVVGKYLMEVFANVERSLVTALLYQPHVEAAGASFMGVSGAGEHDPKVFGGLNRLEQQSILLSGNPAKSNLLFETGVSGKLGQVDNPATIEVRFGGPSPQYLTTNVAGREVGIVPLVESSQKILRLSDSEVGGLLGSSRAEMDKRLGAIVPKTSFKGEAKQLEAAKATLLRAAFLSATVEPSRRGGITTATAIAASLTHSGAMTPRELLAGEGGAMAHKLAASQRNPANESPKFAGELMAARAETERKVFRIMSRLRAAANGAVVVMTPGGFNAQAFAMAVDQLLRAIINNWNGRIVDELALFLEAELRVFLQKYHGR